MKITLINKTECNVAGEVLKVNQAIEYKSATDQRTTMGKVVEFKQVNEESVWMWIAELGKESTTEWISCYTWKNQLDRGFFNTKTKQDDANQSNESADVAGFPF